MYIYGNISLNSSYNAKFFRQKLQRKSKHTFCINFFFFLENLAFYENVEKYFRAGQATLHAGYLRLQIHTHSGCVILIAFPLQQWLTKCASILSHTYITCLVKSWILKAISPETQEFTLIEDNAEEWVCRWMRIRSGEKAKDEI